MADKNDKKSFEFTDNAMAFALGEKESVEHLMARMQFMEVSTFPISKEKIVNMDGNNDGVLTADEVLQVLNEPSFKDAFAPNTRKSMLEAANNAKKDGKPLVTVDEITEKFLETVIIELRSKKELELPGDSNSCIPRQPPKNENQMVEAIKGNIPDALLALLDIDGNGRVSVGEAKFHDMQKEAVQLPEKPQDNLPHKAKGKPGNGPRQPEK